MNREQEEKLKSMEYAKANLTQGSIGYSGPSTGLAQEPMREMMVQRFRNRLERATRERMKSERLEELLYLLDKNPEVARILDLVDAMGSEY